MLPEIKIDTSDLQLLAEGLEEASQAHRDIIAAEFEGLGRALTILMRDHLEKHRYTGALEGSIKFVYDRFDLRLEVGPTAKRGGKWDAGLLLQRGTRPIPNLPFEPIKRWANFRGLPAGPVWMKLRTEGVDAHPWVQEFLEHPATRAVIRLRAKRMGLDLIGYAVQKLPGGGFVGPTSEFSGART